MTTDEVAAVLRVTPRAVQKLADRGGIPFVRVGRLLRFRPEVLREWIAEGCPRPRRPGRRVKR